MPSIIVKMRKQKAIWWKRTGIDKNGVNIYAQPVVIDCRWENTNEEIISSKGIKLVANIIVYVDREMAEQDMLSNADESILQSCVEPRECGAHEIKRFAKLPNLKNTENLLTAYL